jgi:glucokinase
MPGHEFVAAVDFGGSKVAVASATLSGEIIDRVRFETDAPRGAEQALQRAIEAARSIISAAEGKTGGRCAAAGVVSPGIRHAGRIFLAPNVPGWEDLQLESLLREALGVEPVAFGNDVKAAGLAELRWGNLAGADPALFLNLGTGVAAAVLVGGRVLGGAHGAAGEIGYSLRGVDDHSSFADGRAPLEEIAGGRFIGARASRLVGRELSAAEAFAARDPATQALVDETLDELALHVANMALLLDPERIAVGGGMMESGDRILGALERRLQSAVPFPPSLGRARFADDAALRGAVAFALDALESTGSDARPVASASGARQ